MSWIRCEKIKDGPLRIKRNYRSGAVTAECPVVYLVEADGPVSSLDVFLGAAVGGNAIPALTSSYSTSRPNCRLPPGALDVRGAQSCCVRQPAARFAGMISEINREPLGEPPQPGVGPLRAIGGRDLVA